MTTTYPLILTGKEATDFVRTNLLVLVVNNSGFFVKDSKGNDVGSWEIKKNRQQVTIKKEPDLTGTKYSDWQSKHTP